MDLALLGHDLSYQIEIAHRDATRGNKQVAADGLTELLAQALNCITSHAQPQGPRAGASYRCFQQIAITIANFARSQRLIDINHLVACTQDGNLWATNHWYCGLTKRG